MKEDGLALLHISRGGPITGLMVKYRILMDGEEIGRVGYGKSADILIPEGKRTLEVKQSYQGSDPLAIDFKDGDEIWLTCGAKGWYGLYVLARTVIKPGSALYLKQKE